MRQVKFLWETLIYMPLQAIYVRFTCDLHAPYMQFTWGLKACQSHAQSTSDARPAAACAAALGPPNVYAFALRNTMAVRMGTETQLSNMRERR